MFLDTEYSSEVFKTLLAVPILVKLQGKAKSRSSCPEVLCKNRCFYKFRKIHRKTPVPVSLFYTKKRISDAGVFL